MSEKSFLDLPLDVGYTHTYTLRDIIFRWKWEFLPEWCDNLEEHIETQILNELR